MRKQTKLVAVLSTAALLALGASMSSFAATGWQEENGTWTYYDKNGDKETEKWEKSGDNWFYLNDDGEMSTDAIVEYNDNYYYVDENGSMVANKWVSVENTNYDSGNEDEPTNHWYYFGANGKAYKSPTSSDTASFKTINGKKYIFDEEGKMLFGWINKNGQKETGDDAWRTNYGVYYLGDENDGAQTIGWKNLNITDGQWDSVAESGHSNQNVFDDKEQDRWFYFKSNGKKMEGKKGETINGKKYSFDEDGRMNAEWVNWDHTPTTDSDAKVATYAQGFRYYGSPEDGARVTKGWFQVVPDSYLDEGDYNDDSENWYYSDKDGKLITSELKTINGKKYAFNEVGAMQDGYMFIKLGNDKKKIELIAKKDTDKVPSKTIGDDDNYKFDTVDGFKKHAASWEKSEFKLYYFGSGDDGSMKVNKQTISIDGENQTFLLNKSGSYKGSGKTGIDNKKYYQSGMLMAADKDDKYAVIKITKASAASSTINHIELLTTDEFIDGVQNNVTNENKYTEEYNMANKNKEDGAVVYRLVNTVGSVQQSKSKAKDGNDRCYEVKASGEIVRVFVEK
jgi:glucan-binding YG repeat protein